MRPKTGENRDRSSGVDHTSVRRTNLGVVLKHVAERGPRSRATIAVETGFHKTTVSSLVSELIERGLLRETGQEENPGAVGRPAQTVQLNADSVVALGIEVNVDHLMVCTVDLSGRIRQRSFAAGDNGDGDAPRVLDELAGLTTAALERAEAEGLTPVGVGVAVPGLVDVDGGTLMVGPNLGWSELPVAAMLSARLGREGLPVMVDNDANLGALAELWDGVGRNLRDFVYVSGNIGVGAGIVLGGELFRGAYGFGGEFGHITIDPDGRPCRCGSRGCVETLVGQEALVQLAGLEDDALTRATASTEIAARARAGDARVLGALAEVARHLGVALASTANLLNPQAIVLGGQFAPVAGWLQSGIASEIASRMLASRWCDCRVIASELGGDAAARGAAALLLRRVLAEPWRVALPTDGGQAPSRVAPSAP
jgi:predicted NBD/HSP70 family sugar kinase